MSSQSLGPRLFDSVQTTYEKIASARHPTVSDPFQIKIGEMTIGNPIVHGALDTDSLRASPGLVLTKGTPTEAVINIDAVGDYIGANQAALDLLGVSLEELLASGPDRFSITPADTSERAALRAEWESDGSRPLVGTAGLKRADGSTIRVSYAIEATASGFSVRMWQVDGLPQAPPSVFTVGAVLREWRAAERSLTALHPGSVEWARTLSEIEMLRGQYQELFRSVAPHADGGSEGTA